MSILSIFDCRGVCPLQKCRLVFHTNALLIGVIVYSKNELPSFAPILEAIKYFFLQDSVSLNPQNMITEKLQKEGMPDQQACLLDDFAGCILF